MKGNRTAQSPSSIALRPNGIALLVGLLAGFLSATLTGCGAPAAPLPPTLNLPQPVRDLAAKRAGDTVHISFTVPQKTTDKLPVRGSMTAQLCRAVESGPCRPAGTLAIPNHQAAASMEDALPPDLTQGPPRLLTYRLTVQNRAEKAGEPSNRAYSAAGAAPAPVAGLSVTPRRAGIVLSWQPAEAPATLRIERTRTSAAPEQPKVQSTGNLAGRKSAPEPAEQTLRLAEPARAVEGHLCQAIDATAHTGNSYRYVIQRVAQITEAGHDLEVASQPTAPFPVDYRDVFPPPVPTGLVSAADSASRSIDLDWTPDVDAGLAGYIVYRRPTGANQPPERVSDKPVTTSTWSDTTAQPGQRYAYSVSAIDKSGNESRRSGEVEDQWTAPNPSRNPQP
jgi:hypothetical protein